MFQFPTSIRVGARLEEVADAIALATASFVPLIVYVERRGDFYRWSPAHRGGPYPLMRVTARVLGVDHHALVLPFATRDGVCIIPALDGGQAVPGSWTVLELIEPATAGDVRRLIEQGPRARVGAHACIQRS